MIVELLLVNNMDNTLKLNNGSTLKLTSKDAMGLLLGLIKADAPRFFSGHQTLGEIDLQNELAKKIGSIWCALRRKSKIVSGLYVAVLTYHGCSL